jgi:hypothetical protein
MKHHVLRISALLLSSIVLQANSCTDDVTSPEMGGRNNEPRRCASGANARWNDNHLNVEVTKPGCPYTFRQVSSAVTFAGRVTAPSSKIYFSFGTVSSYVNFEVHDWFTGYYLGSDPFNYYSQSPGDPTVYVAEVSYSATPGSKLDPQDGSRVLDSLHLRSEFMSFNGAAEAWKILPGRIDPTAPAILGASGVESGVANTWRIYPEWDTTAYRYRWLIDGSEVPSANGAQLSTTLSNGTHTITGILIRADGTEEAVPKTVKAFSVSISGPDLIQPSVECSWFGDAYGGAGPYQFEWNAPGSGPTSGQYFNYWNSGSSFQMTLAVTDASGATVQIAKSVTVSSGADVCAY